MTTPADEPTAAVEDEERRSETPTRRRFRPATLLLVAVLLYLVGSNVWTQITADEAEVTAERATQGQREAQREAKSLAEQVAEACARGGPAAAELGSACVTARDIQRDPVGQPRDGEDGKDGRGIAATVIADGHLLVTYTDGAVEDKGAVVGADGKPGKDGRSIRSSTVADGALVLAYSDGTSEVAGVVVGRDGADGADGRGVAGVAVTADFRLVVSYTDGTTADVGPLPRGQKGEPGRGIESVEFDMADCSATVHYSDGTSEPAPMTGCDPQEPDPEPTPPGGGLLPGG